MPFPVAKLGYLAIKQISKPLAHVISRKAKASPLLRKCISVPAQFYHSLETKVRMRLLGFRKEVKEVKPLNEEMAVELGAEMLGEILIFIVGAAIIGAEYTRQARKEQSKEDAQNARLTKLEMYIEEGDLALEYQKAQIARLNRIIEGQDLGRKGSCDSIDKIVDNRAGVKLQVQR